MVHIDSETVVTTTYGVEVRDDADEILLCIAVFSLIGFLPPKETSGFSERVREEDGFGDVLGLHI